MKHLFIGLIIGILYTAAHAQNWQQYDYSQREFQQRQLDLQQRQLRELEAQRTDRQIAVPMPGYWETLRELEARRREQEERNRRPY